MDRVTAEEKLRRKEGSIGRSHQQNVVSRHAFLRCLSLSTSPTLTDGIPRRGCSKVPDASVLSSSVIGILSTSIGPGCETIRYHARSCASETNSCRRSSAYRPERYCNDERIRIRHRKSKHATNVR
jgi:hypothetical protein